MRFILASGSPRRRALLEAAGFDFDVEESGVEEALRAGEPAEAFAQRVAREKALCVVRPGRVRARCHSEPFACRTERSEGPRRSAQGKLRDESRPGLALDVFRVEASFAMPPVAQVFPVAIRRFD